MCKQGTVKNILYKSEKYNKTIKVWYYIEIQANTVLYACNMYVNVHCLWLYVHVVATLLY